MNEHLLKDRLLSVMAQKQHWASGATGAVRLSPQQADTLLRHETAVYLRELPRLRALAFANVPSNITVTLPALTLARSEQPIVPQDNAEEDLHPAAESYKQWLRDVLATSPWQASVALLTIFVEEDARHEIWNAVLEHARSEAIANHVLRVCMEGLARWHRYRDGVAERMGITLDQAA